MFTRCGGAGSVDASSKTGNKVRLDFLLPSGSRKSKTDRKCQLWIGVNFIGLRLNPMVENKNPAGYNVLKPVQHDTNEHSAVNFWSDSTDVLLHTRTKCGRKGVKNC